MAITGSCPELCSVCFTVTAVLRQHERHMKIHGGGVQRQRWRQIDFDYPSDLTNLDAI